MGRPILQSCFLFLSSKVWKFQRCIWTMCRFKKHRRLVKRKKNLVDSRWSLQKPWYLVVASCGGDCAHLGASYSCAWCHRTPQVSETWINIISWWDYWIELGKWESCYVNMLTASLLTICLSIKDQHSTQGYENNQLDKWLIDIKTLMTWCQLSYSHCRFCGSVVCRSHKRMTLNTA